MFSLKFGNRKFNKNTPPLPPLEIKWFFPNYDYWLVDFQYISIDTLLSNYKYSMLVSCHQPLIKWVSQVKG